MGFDPSTARWRRVARAGQRKGAEGGGGGAGGFKKGALGATFVRRPFVASKRQLPTLIKATTSYTPYEV